MSRSKEYEKVRDRNDPLERYTISTRLLCEIVRDIRHSSDNLQIAQDNKVGERIVELIRGMEWTQ